MLKYDKIDITEGIDINKTNKSRECMFCHYWYFLNKNFSYGPFTCNGCYNIVQRSTDFKYIAIVQKLMNKFDLIGKTGNIYCND